MIHFCLNHLQIISLADASARFSPMFDLVHIDEKWFYLTEDAQRYYLLPDGQEPTRYCQSEHFIQKVMFLAAVARPVFDSNRTLLLTESYRDLAVCGSPTSTDSHNKQPTWHDDHNRTQC